MDKIFIANCIEDIQEYLSESFDGEHINFKSAPFEALMRKHGTEIMSAALAGCVYNKVGDGRISQLNKVWAQTYAPAHLTEGQLSACNISTHPGIFDYFVTMYCHYIGPVKTVCYGKTKQWDNRFDALDFFSSCERGSEGAERERYNNIIDSLRDGYITATDGY